VCGWASDYNPAPRANCRINAGPPRAHIAVAPALCYFHASAVS